MNNQTPDLNNPFIRIDETQDNKVQPTTEAKLAGPPVSFLGCLSAILLFLAIVFGIFSLGKFIKNKALNNTKPSYNTEQRTNNTTKVLEDIKHDDINHLEGTNKKEEKIVDKSEQKDKVKKEEKTNSNKLSDSIDKAKSKIKKSAKCTPELCKTGQLSGISKEVKSLQNKLLLNPSISLGGLNLAKNKINSLKEKVNSLKLGSINLLGFNLDSNTCLIKDKDKYLAYWAKELNADLDLLDHDVANLLSSYSASHNAHRKHYSSSKAKYTRRYTPRKKSSYRRSHKKVIKPKYSSTKTTTASTNSSTNTSKVHEKFNFSKLKEVETITNSTDTNSSSNTSVTTSTSDEKFELSATKKLKDRSSYCPKGFLSNFDGKCYPESKFYYDCGKGYTLNEKNYCVKVE